MTTRFAAVSIVLLVFFFLFIPRVFCADVELDALLKETGARLEWNPLLQSGTMVSKVSQVVFSVGAPYLLVNGVQKIGVEPVKRSGSRLLFPESTAREIRQIFDELSQPPRLFRVAAIVIDPGHGGRDSGASYVHTIGGKQVRVSEKDIVLSLAMKLQAMLEERYKDKVILLTRETDVYIPLEDRPYVANTISAKPDEAIIYISLHANASMSQTGKGFEVWYLTPTYKRELVSSASVGSEYSEVLPVMNHLQEEEFTRESILLAREITAQLVNSIGNVTENRGLKEGEWLVVRKAKMPSILVEVGFVSNRDEAARLLDPAYLQKITQALYNGVSLFIEQYENSKGFTE